MNSENKSFGVAHPLSLKITTFLISMVAVPNALLAVLMTADPSETEEEFTTSKEKEKLPAGHRHDW